MCQSSYTDRRSRERLRVFYGAHIATDLLSPTIECQVRSFSLGGARLAATTRRPLPKRFDLRVDRHDRPFRAEIVWSKGDEIGVRFLRERRFEAMPTQATSMEDRQLGAKALRKRFQMVTAD